MVASGHVQQFRGLVNYLGDSLKKETGVDLKDASSKVYGFMGEFQDSVLKSQAEFKNWNEWERWKEVKDKISGLSPQMFEDFVKPFQINPDDEGPIPHNERLRYQPLDVYPAPLHRC